ncbi:MAG: adenine-specific methyltransferase EcoRI family protein [Paludibacteraceae bacterium]|nr:adenine-specific methyltransferase EcoRI family protein [Paludibacteraceae bacterium]
MANKNLNQAKDAKKDEFYTQLADIEKELRHYTEHFRDKTVFCNCDDPYESNFFKYFALNFNRLGLKRLIATCYDGSPVLGNELLLDFGETTDLPKKIAYKVDITEVTDVNGDGAINLADIQYLMQNDKNVISILKGNGDFRSDECVELLKQADIVVTNPPFSLFREYIAQLIKYEKLFLIIGPYNALTYKEIFPLIRDNKMWLGYGFQAGNAYFRIPNNSTKEYVEGVFDESTGLVKFRNCTWYTNIDHVKRHEELILYKNYTLEEYPHYDNYYAIEVKKVSDIPYDYEGVMGVPITFIDKFNPDQFQILGITENNINLQQYWIPNCKKYDRPYLNGERKYSRILIRKKQK